MVATIIGKSMVVDGEITGTQNIQVIGKVSGRIDGTVDVHIDEDGKVEGVVQANNVDIAGTLEGDAIASDKCQIQNAGVVVGDIRSKRILIADGAIFRGKVEMERHPSDSA